jgi:hypothetical protein
VKLPPRALRHVKTHRWAFTAVAATVLLTSAFTAAAAAFLSAVAIISVRTELSRDPGAQVVITSPVTASSLGQADAQVRYAITGARPGQSGTIPAAISTSLQSGTMRLLSPAGRPTRLETQLASLPQLSRHARLISGQCHLTGQVPAGRPIPACLPVRASRALGLTVGDRITVRDAVSGARISVVITGLIQPAAAASRYWLLDPMGQAPVHLSSGLETAGPLLVSPAARSRFAVSSAAWLGQPDFLAVNDGELASVGAALGDRLTALQNSQLLSSAVVTTNLPAELGALATALVVTRTELLTGLLTLLVIAGATLALAVRLLSQRREGEAALLAARGASRVQLARRAGLDAVIVAIPAAIIGPLLGTVLAQLLLTAGLRPAGVPAAALTPAAIADAWLVAIAVALGGIAIVALPWLRQPPSPLRRRAAAGRQRSIAAAVYARADLAVVAIAAAAAWQLVHSHGVVSAGLAGHLSADPILLAAPVLALVAGALLTLRLLPIAARLGDRVAARGRGLVVPVAAWQISRRTLRQAGPTLVGVLAVAAAVMALSQRDSWHDSVRAQASFTVGADTRITMPPAAQTAIGQVTGIVRAPGVTASTPAVRATISLPNNSLGTLLALDTSAAAKVIPASAAGPSPAALHRLAAAVPDVGAALPGRPAALRFTAALTGGKLGQPELFVQLTDAAGIGYLVPAGPLASGEPRRLTVTIAPGNNADYPLRLTGFALQFNSPVQQRQPSTLTLSAGQALASPGSGSGTSISLAPPGSRLDSSALSMPGGQAPAVTKALASQRGDVVTTFSQGVLPEQQERSLTEISVSDRYRGQGQPLPAVVTNSFLAVTGSKLGDHLEATVDGTTVQITPLVAMAHLPTMAADSPAVLVDQTALTDELLAAGAQPESITQWWLKTTGPVSFAGLPPGTATAHLAKVARVLAANPLTLASQQALLALAIAAALLAIIGMLVSVATASERARDVALLDALGMPPRQVARLLGLEQGLTAVAPSAIGLLFGGLLSELIVPAVTLTSQAARPIPPVSVQVPWLLAGLVALALAVLPTLAIGLALPRRDSGAARIRMAEET